MNKIKWLLNKEFFRYLVVGGGAVFLDLIVYYVLTSFTGVSPSWSKRISFIIGAVWSFFANKFFTFRKKDLSLTEPVLFAGVYLSGFILNSIIHDYVYNQFNSKELGFVLATVASIIWNYIGQKWLVFRKRKLQKDD